MVLACARAQRGRRAYAPQPKAHGENISLIGAMSLKDGFLNGLSFIGGTTGDLFLWLIEILLCSHLWPGAVVVMDNLPAHKVAEAITAAGARLVYLSPYSPEFSPIEHLWSKLKAFFRSKVQQNEIARLNREFKKEAKIFLIIETQKGDGDGQQVDPGLIAE
jgi:transposase